MSEYGNFERIIKEKGITAYRVAKETGITTATLTSWKQGNRTPVIWIKNRYFSPFLMISWANCG